jgi:muramidase (phage lysozyme)
MGRDFAGAERELLDLTRDPRAPRRGTLEYYEAYLANPNVQKFLAMTRMAETTGYANPYGTYFGGGQFTDYSRHPGIRHRDGNNASTAAGAYQFVADTWNGVQRDLGLADFSPRNQDIGALALMDRNGSMGEILNGDVAGFIRKNKGTWASFPGANARTAYGKGTQPMKSMQAMMDFMGMPNNAAVQMASYDVPSGQQGGGFAAAVPDLAIEPSTYTSTPYAPMPYGGQPEAPSPDMLAQAPPTPDLPFAPQAAPAAPPMPYDVLAEPEAAPSPSPATGAMVVTPAQSFEKQLAAINEQLFGAA